MALNIDTTKDQSEDDDKLLFEPNLIGASPNYDSTRLKKLPLLERLGKLPKRREIPWQEGKELPPEKSTDSSRLQQRGACLLSTRGNTAPVACDHCIKTNNGRFTDCIALFPWFQGACCACVFTSKGNRCSLRVQTIGKADGSMLRHAVDEGLSDGPKSSKKRRMHSSSTEIHPSSNDASTDLNALLQNQVARDSPQAPSKAHISPEETDSSKIQIQISPAGTNVQRKSEQTALAQNRPPPVRLDVEQKIPTEQMSAKIVYNQPPPARTHKVSYTTKTFHSSTPISYPPKDLPALQNVLELPLETFRTINPNIQRNFTPINIRPNKTYITDAAPPPLIATLPEAAQKRIYALITGIQGRVLDLQEQLDSLKVSLGIEAVHSENET